MSKALGTTGFTTFDAKFGGIYRGTVEDNNDPEQLGRVKVRVYPMFAGVEASLLPWAIIQQPMFEGSGAGIGYFAVPDVGTNVYVMFEEGSPYQPIVTGEAPDKVKGLPAERVTNYPNRKVLKTSSGITIYIDDTSKTVSVKTPSGHELLVDDTTNVSTLSTNGNIKVELNDASQYMNLLHPSGAFIKIDPIGQVLISCLNLSVVTTGTSGSGNANITITGNVDLLVQGTTELESVGAMVIKGSTVSINP